MAKGDSFETLKWYRLIFEYLESQFEELPHTPEQIDKFLLSCKGGDERRHGFYRALRALYRLLNRRLDIDNIILKVEPPRRKKKLPHSLTIEELIRLLEYPHPPNKKAGIRGTAHTLRHTFGTLWEGDEFALQQILGHSNFEMLRRYRNLRTAIIARQHHQYTPLKMAHQTGDVDRNT